MESNYTIKEIGLFENLLERETNGMKGKYFLGQDLGLTGCEVSLNRLPAGKGMPFVHAHKQNEELYLVLRGKGIFFADGREFPVAEGSAIRMAPSGERSISAGTEDLYFICIQTRAKSLVQATRADGIRLPTKTSWIDK